MKDVRQCGYRPDLYMVYMGEESLEWGMLVAERLRTALPTLTIEAHLAGGGFKRQFKHADKSGAAWALIIGDEEKAANKVSLKNLREDIKQQQLTLDELITFFRGTQS